VARSSEEIALDENQTPWLNVLITCMSSGEEIFHGESAVGKGACSKRKHNQDE
jgi:hypothetical protein